MDRKRASVSPWSTSTRATKRSISLSGDWTKAFVFLYNIIMAVIISSGIPYRPGYLGGSCHPSGAKYLLVFLGCYYPIFWGLLG